MQKFGQLVWPTKAIGRAISLISVAQYYYAMLEIEYVIFLFELKFVDNDCVSFLMADWRIIGARSSSC